MPIELEERQRLLETVRGERPADLFIRGGKIANVYSGELHEGNVAVAGERIAYVGEGEQAIGPQTKVLDASGRIVSPGYIESHPQQLKQRWRPPLRRGR